MDRQLSKIVIQKIKPLINSNYIFLDLPYYTNIGDTLIWKGTEEFLKKMPYKCLYRASIETYNKPSISKDTTILLQGGGNFGDIWRRHTEFCIRVMKDFPENPIIILPQTVYYVNNKILKQDALEMGKHKNVSICARDHISYKLLVNNFSKNNILLAPDMAFCISNQFLNRYAKREQNKVLFFKRKDKELQDYDFKRYLPERETIDQREWPSMDQSLVPTKILNALFRGLCISRKIGFGHKQISQLIDLYANEVYMPFLLKIGIRFLSQYKYVYTTRLHGAILSILLKKPLTFFDNSYGKNSTFFDSWLKDFKNIKLIKTEN
ncbi:polysaccharide pyruvyl transferase family protein [Sunxiuqinia indica]|uniref:polysaccharide pyruvyl transferase family protein n=1 Tax=Sunxiuqinia indica TaxID=2692584 RepID=UPI00135B6386|nr:polysaccharide pyruvyl transferase family protein [Sunxiuqinia indica]